MSLSALSVGILEMVDVQAPGVPRIVALSQASNSSANLAVELPTHDSDGSELTGLALLRVYRARTTPDGLNPFEGLTAEAAAQVPGVLIDEISLTPEQAGTVVEAPLAGMSVGMWAAAACCGD